MAVKTKSGAVSKQGVSLPSYHEIHADAREIPLESATADVVVTSPPYWKKRDYSFVGQIGQEPTPKEFASTIVDCMREWRRLLTPHGSVFVNLGDTYHNKSLAGVPGRVEAAAADDGWVLRNRIIWAKEGGMPEPAKNRLANRHEYILHFTRDSDYYYDTFAYSEQFGNGSTPGDVWNIALQRSMGSHLAPFPEELVERALTLACPLMVCNACGKPRERIITRTAELDPTRPQAVRAMELAKKHQLTDAHIAAIQATGISDAGKALKVQTGTGRNAARVQILAAEAKLALGGYFREFTFAKKRTTGWTDCGCNAGFRPGVVLDPFKGTGTTLRVAKRLQRSAIGVDFAPLTDRAVWSDSGTDNEAEKGRGSRRVGAAGGK
ncbi:site-specific DNA-methyltransferase [Xanthomonas sp. WHRI 10064A]|uniref:DNA-methyltransferase n=1 Tax=unclassified Xanthomonas TaxID=2643310 RepID=UPI002B226096|nr:MULTISPECIES: site-specific DNA-methyltransferase [unclassified Xanthomonas]MEA9586892.1 site-specific DNA-methyltransferase [Xanthomonas sp. WHRI 10064B]MEA9616083.1 site-specific DNA-methyltransferase [Xanthomonas sp. WHRI 10064A]